MQWISVRFFNCISYQYFECPISYSPNDFSLKLELKNSFSEFRFISSMKFLINWVHRMAISYRWHAFNVNVSHSQYYRLDRLAIVTDWWYYYKRKGENVTEVCFYLHFLKLNKRRSGAPAYFLLLLYNNSKHCNEKRLIIINHINKPYSTIDTQPCIEILTLKSLKSC